MRMTTIWTYEEGHPEPLRPYPEQQLGLESLWSRPRARPETHVRYHFLWSPKPARLPLYSILPWLRLSTPSVLVQRKMRAVLGT